MYEDRPCTSATLATPVSPIESALSELGEEISALEKYVVQLRARASKVTVPAPPAIPASDGICPPNGPPHSATWNSIIDAKARICSIGDDIRDLTARLET